MPTKGSKQESLVLSSPAVSGAFSPSTMCQVYPNLRIFVARLSVLLALCPVGLDMQMYIN
jgi:hypothetical protein